MANSDVLIKIGGDTSEWKSSLAGLGEELLSSIEEMNPAVAGLVSTVSGIAVAATDSALQFEEAYDQIIAKTGATGDQLEGLKQSFDDVFTSVPVEAEQLAGALSLVSDRLHLTGDDLTALTTQISQLSVVTGENATTIADAATKAMQNWGIATDDQKSKLDLLNTISQQTGVSVTSLATTMSSVGNLARLSGQDFDTVAGQIGELTSKGVDAQTVFQGMSRAMAQAQKDGLDLSQVTLVNLIGTIEDGITSGTGLNDALALFGTRAGPQMYQLVKDGIVSSTDLMKQSFDGATDSINKTYQATDTFGKQLTVLTNNMKSALQPIGDWFVDLGKSILSVINTAFNGGVSPELQASFDKLNGSLSQTAQWVGTLNDKLTAAKPIGDSISAMTAQYGLNLSDVAVGANKSTTEHTNLIAAEQAAAEHTALLQGATELLAATDSQHAEDLKANYTPAIYDLATAQNFLTQYKTEAILADQNLTDAEQQLRDLLASGTATNKQLQDAETGVNEARQTAASTAGFLSQAEKDLTASKTADSSMTTELKAAYSALTDALKTDHIPAIQALSDAETVVQKAHENTQDAISTEQAAYQALSDFQNQTGFKDAATEQQLKDDLTNATKSLTDARNTEAQAITDSNTVKQAQMSLDNDILTNTKLLDSYTRDNVLGTDQTLLQAMSDIQAAKQKQLDTWTQLQAALQQEQTLQQSGTVDIKAETDARNAAKVAADNYKASTDAVNTAETLAQRNYGLSKDAITLLTTSVTNATQAAQLQQTAFNVLGVQSAQSLQNLATASDKAYQDILQTGTASSAQLRDAYIADLTAQANALAANGQTLSATDQLTLAQLKQQHSDFQNDIQNSWGNLYSTLDKDVQNVAASMLNTLFTGQGSFHDEAIKGLEDIGDAVVTKFTKPFTDAVASLISGAITDLLSGKGLGGIQTSLSNIGTSIASDFSSASTSGISSLNNLPLGATGLASDGSSAGSSAGSAASGVSSALGSVTGIITAIGSIGSMITGAIGDVMQAHANNVLGEIEENTRYAQLYLGGRADQGILGVLFTLDNDLQFGYTSKQTLEMLNWIKGAGQGKGLVDALNDVSTNTYWSLQKLSDLDNFTSYSIVPALQQIAQMGAPTVNVAVTLDGAAIASSVSTTIEQNIKQAIA